MHLFRFPGLVEARQVTVDNQEEIARWCGGSVRGILLPPEARHIEMRYDGVWVQREAVCSDWVVKMSATRFLVVDALSFSEMFEELRNDR